MSIFDW